MPKYLLETYGCQMNLADAELLAGILGDHGWEPTTEAHEADLILVNTCAVRERAAARVIGHLRSYRPLRARRPHLRIAMVGCLARYDGRELARQLRRARARAAAAGSRPVRGAGRIPPAPGPAGLAGGRTASRDRDAP
jgi:tRNA A37 methylthiotransferase MiaB